MVIFLNKEKIKITQSILIFAIMEFNFFNPFETLHFEENTCFLTGDELNDSNTSILVFPEWVLEKFELKTKKFQMMDAFSPIQYSDLKLPCSQKVKNAFDALDEKINTAFEAGFQNVKGIDEQELFLWMGRIVYGILYFDLKQEQLKQQKSNAELSISPHLKDRFAKFHLMLQSIVSPVSFGEHKPWSIAIVPLKYSKDVFNYRDDTVNLIFSLGMNGFGIIACLQDNGINLTEHQRILDKISNTVLHPVQFEELVGRFMYSNYLLRYQPTYIMEEQNHQLHIESKPIIANENRPLFGVWEDKMFGQVLAGLWKPWGITEKEIVADSSSPRSYLINERTLEFIDPEKISLPF